MSTDFRRSSVYASAPAQQHRRSVAGGLGRRSRSHSAVRDNVMDARRHVTSVAQNSQALADKFTEQLKKYKTFAPIFATSGVYAEAPQGSTTSNAIDQILDVRSSFLVRHTTHHRIMQPSPIEHPGAKRLASLSESLIDGDNFPSSGPSRLQRDSLAPRPPQGEAVSEDNTPETDSAYLIWLQENPDASNDQRAAELHRRHKEKVEAERVSRAKYLRKWHAELEMALAEDQSTIAANAADASVHAVNVPSSVIAPRPPPRRHSVYDVEMQKIAWNVFQSGIPMAANVEAHSGHPPTKDVDRRRLSLKAVTGNPVEAAALHDWVEGVWMMHTHRHEAAALSIQCAFRCYRAKRVVHRGRYLRCQLHLEQLKSEEEAMFAWRIAVEMMSEPSNNETHADKEDEEGDKTVQIIHSFIGNVMAMVKRRRAAKQQAADRKFELETFAALRVQAVYRGHRARTLVNELRHPEIGQRRRHAESTAASTLIQKTWRRYAVLCRIRRMHIASMRIQCCVRRHVAVQKLAIMRRGAREKVQRELAYFASTRIKRFIRSVIARRRRRYQEFMPQIRCIFRVTSGYRDRSAMIGLQRVKLDAAATIIGKVYRGHLAKIVAARARVEAEAANIAAVRQEAALVIQRSVRRRIALVAQRSRLRDYYAARHIQRVVRGHFDRKSVKMKQLAVEANREQACNNDAALLIQAAIRGHAVRAQTAQGGVGSIPSNTDGATLPSSQVTATVEHDAAVMIQDFYYTRIRLPRLSRCIRSAGRIVSLFMMRVSAYREVQRRKERCLHCADDAAATCIQLSVKAYLARQLIASLRTTRRTEQSMLQDHEASLVLTKFFRYVVTKRRIAKASM